MTEEEEEADVYARSILTKDCCDLKLVVYKRGIAAYLAGHKACEAARVDGITCEELTQEAIEYAREHDIYICGEEYWSLEDLAKAYIAGSIKNGTVWHDLSKNPKDLPESDGALVLGISKGYCGVSYPVTVTYTVCFDGKIKWLIHAGAGKSEELDIIAWSEIPRFVRR